MEAQPKCNLIIDSCCDLPFEVVDRPGVQLLEFPYIDEKGEHSDDFYRSVTPHEFYEGMRAGSQPSTAQVPVTVFHDVFSKAIESGVPTVYLSFTSGLSGSFNTAVMMRDQPSIPAPSCTWSTPIWRRSPRRFWSTRRSTSATTA